MRKTLCILLSVLMIIAPLTLGVAAVDGTAINSAADFAAMDPAGTYYLAKDITLSETYAETFTGTLNGNGKKITTSVPVFAMLDGATISNLTLAGAVEIENAGTGGAAVLANKSNAATLTKVTNNATLTIKSLNGNGYIGTLIGSVSKGTLTVTDCVNNANVLVECVIGGSVAPRTGGLTGNLAKDVVPTFTNCVNNGNVTYNDTAATVTTGACYIGGITSDCFIGTFTNCVNNGNITANVPIDGAGICGRTPPSKQLADHSVTYTNCVNNGNVITSAKTGRAIGGIQGYAGASGVVACYKIDHCVNTGKIAYTNPEATGNIGGLAGYVYGTGTTEYISVTFCINTGDVTSAGTTYVSEFIGYSNSNGNVVANNVGLGKLSTGVRVFDGADVYTTVIIGASSADMSTANITNNFVLDTAGLNWKVWTATAENTVSRIPAADAPAGDIVFVTSDDVASGALAYMFNQAVGDKVLFQNIDKGTKDAIPTLDSTHGVVYSNDGNYSNTLVCKHVGKVKVATTATCTEGGIDAHYECEDCGSWLKADGKTLTTAAELQIDALGHSCAKANSKGQYICDRCGLFAKGKVYNETDFLAMAPVGGEFTLANNITITKSYTNIVNEVEEGFQGTFDGAGYTISGNVMVFARINNATIKNVVIGSKTKPGTVAGTDDEATVVGTLAGTTGPNGVIVIENVTNYNNVVSADAAGIIGEFSNGGTVTIKNVVNYGNMQGDDQVGGIVGWLKGGIAIVDGCANYGTISSINVAAANGNYAGGILGRWGDGKTTVNGEPTLLTITNCVNEGDVNSFKSQTGGIVGYINQSITVIGCTNKADLDESAAGVCGGILGAVGYLIGSTTTIVDCVNEGNLVGKTNCGGIIGNGYAEMTIVDHCVNKGNVTAIGSEAGGIGAYIGYAASNSDGSTTASLASFKFTNCYNYGNVLSNGTHVGGIVGGSNGNKQKLCYWIEKCGNFGNVTLDSSANKNLYCGGIIGYLYGGDNANGVVDCFNVGKVSGNCTSDATGATTYTWVGGIAAYFNTKNIAIHGNYNAGAVSHADARTAKTEKVTVAEIYVNNNADGLDADHGYNNWALNTGADFIVNNAGVAANDLAQTFEAADLTNGKLVKALNEGEGETVYFQGAECPVHELSVVYGDVNGDGEVSAKDIALLRKYLANLNTETGVSTVEIGAGADADGNGTVNAKDIALLRKFLANYNAETGASTIVLGPQA